MTNSNRGRDLPRGQQYIRDVPKGEREVAKQIKIAKRRELARKALAKITGGYDTLFPYSAVNPEKLIAKHRKVVIEALAVGIDNIPKLLLAEVGLEDEPNPPTNYVDNGKAPF